MPKEKVSIGLDIGNRHINMVKLAARPQGMKLLDVASREIDIREGKEGKLRQLEQLVQEKKIASFPVNIGVSGESVIVRYIDLPKMSKNEIGQALKYEAQQYIPFKMEEVLFDYHILEPQNSTRNKLKILLVAAKRQVIIEFGELIKQVGLKPNIIDVNSFSLINCFQKNGPKRKEDDVFALINAEFDSVNIDILQGELPFFTRDISLLEDVLSLREERSQERDTFEIMRPLSVNLTREIRLSIDYYESEFEKQVSLIYLSGEAASLPEMVDLFNNQLGREVSLWNPIQNLIIDSVQLNIDSLKRISPMLALACGLSLRGVK